MRIVFLSLFILLTSTVSSQNLTGVWRGVFSYDDPKWNYSITLDIKRKEDKNYTVFSYTGLYRTDSIVKSEICKMTFKKIGKRKFELEEYENISYPDKKTGFQKMTLTLRGRNGALELVGRWESVEGGEFGQGPAFFRKIK